jgi:RNA polymerase sigma-70 factor (ECF subfamily)
MTFRAVQVSSSKVSAVTDLSERIRTAFTAACAGVPGAMDRFLTAVHAFAVRYCRAALGRQEANYMHADRTAREICGEVRLAMPRYLDHSRPVLAFVYGIAAHRARPGKHHKIHPLGDDPIGKITTLLSHLPNPQREIIILRVMVGFSAQDTAEALGSTPNAVRRSQHIALTTMRGRLG